MRKFYLHIGHGKTGSTMLQSSFWLSRDVLKASGICYPPGSDGTMKNELQITSGNGSGLVSRPARLATALDQSGDSPHVLYSSEFLFVEMRRSNNLERIMKRIHSAGFDQIHVLLFVRDPIGHASSLWQQGIKRSGKSHTIEQFFQSYQMPQRVAEVVQKLHKIPNVILTLRNYSVCRQTLLSEIETWLGISPDSLVAPKAERINRSMTRSELELQLAFNRVLGKSGQLISDPLCETLPDIPSDDIRPSEHIQATTWTRLLPDIEKVNSFLPEGHAYNRDIKPPTDDGPNFTFTAAQIEVIAAGIGARFIKHRETTRKLAGKMARKQVVGQDG